MGSYIARRLLLLIPTLIGLTFLVFMLLALSPGGIGAALAAQGGQMDSTSRAAQQAYLEDRYGLNDPVIVQYLRWLGRVSPVKFGTRSQVTPEGELERPPKPVRPPVNWKWVVDELPVVAPAEPVTWPEAGSLEVGLDETPERALQRYKASTYRRAKSEYLSARGKYLAANAEYETALIAYAREIGLEAAITRDRKLREGVIRRAERREDAKSWAEVQKTGRAAIERYALAQEAGQRLGAIFAAKPFPEAGFGNRFVSIGAPDLGRSFSRSQPVARLIGERLPVTILLNVVAFPIVYAIAIPAGITAAGRRGTLVDAGLGFMAVALWSVPSVFASVMLFGYLASEQHLNLFPVRGLHATGAEQFTLLPTVTPDGWHRGYLLDTLWHLVLPVTVLVYAGFAVLSKQTRAAMLDNYSADFVRTAKAKGVPQRDIVFRHVFRNSLLPLITMFAAIFPTMLAGSVVVEQVFSINGMGRLILEAIYARDREVILANVLIVGGVNILGLLLADILYALADPRISYK